MLRALSLVPAFFLALSAAPAAAAPPAWKVDPAQSTIGFEGAHAGKAFTGRFQTWTADIRFDPADLAASKATVTIQTASAKTGDKFQETTLAEGEWFDVKGHPRAVFTTTQFKSTGANAYEAAGTLTIKGKAVPVVLPFTLSTTGDVATLTGSVKLDRVKLGLGVRSDASGEWVSKIIPVKIKVRATKS